MQSANHLVNLAATEVYIEAISVVDDMKSPIKLSDQIICIKQLKEYLFKADPKTEKYSSLIQLNEFIEGMHVTY